jgi:hypothetical protein
MKTELKIGLQDFIPSNDDQLNSEDVKEISSSDGTSQVKLSNANEYGWSVYWQLKSAVRGFHFLVGLNSNPDMTDTCFALEAMTESKKKPYKRTVFYSSSNGLKQVDFGHTELNKLDKNLVKKDDVRDIDTFPAQINFEEQMIMFVNAVRQFIESDGQDIEIMKAYYDLAFRKNE